MEFQLVNAAIEGVCILICTIMLISCMVETEERNRKYKSFLRMLVVYIGALAFDMCTYIFDKFRDIDVLIYSFNYIALIATVWIITCFMDYTRCCVEEKVEHVSPVPMNLTILYGIASSVAVFVGMITGHVFTVRNGLYAEGDYMGLAIAVLALPLVMALIIILVRWKTLGTHDACAMLLYIIFPIIALILQIYLEGYTLGFVATTMSFLAMYALLQSGEVNSLRIKEGIMREYSRTDVLTGLQNRQAYTEDSAQIKPSQYGGIVFCDINNLKMINDTKGHEAGDGHIIFFAEMLKDSFGKKYSYRISGDEFVVIMTDVSERVFNDRLEMLQKEVRRHARIASLGHKYGSFRVFNRMLREAEDMMYEEKRLYYESLR